MNKYFWMGAGILIITGVFLVCTNNKYMQASVMNALKINTTDAQVFLMGGDTIVAGQANICHNDVYSSRDMINWKLISPDNQNPGTTKWSPRGGQSTLYFNNKLWVIGGQDCQGDPSNEVWSSSDGNSWKLEGVIGTNFSDFRSQQTAVVFKNRMWVIGGHTGVSMWNDVYSSSDGVTWRLETGNAPWAQRYGHLSFVYNDKIWVMGGANSVGGVFANDVWFSGDGKNWTQATAHAVWSPRFGLMGGVYNGKMYVFGGSDLSGTFNDVYSSADGVTWTPVAQNQWQGRPLGVSVVLNKKLYLLGGIKNNYLSLNDVWSYDGSIWKNVTNNPAWNGRFIHSAVVAQ